MDGAVAGFTRLTKAMACAAAFIVLLMSIWITYDVLARNFFGLGSPWFFDLSEYAMVWVTFLGAPWVLLQDRHIRIELLIDVLPRPVQRTLGVAVSVIAIAACLVLMWKSSQAALEYYQSNVMMPRIWRIPRLWPYSIIPVGSLFLVISFLVRLRTYVLSADPEKELHATAMADQHQIDTGGE